MTKTFFLSTIALILFWGCQQNEERKREDFVDSLLAQMSLEEKVGQMTQISISEILDDESVAGWNQSGVLNIDTTKLKYFVKDYHVGSFLNGYAVSSEVWYTFGKTLAEISLEHSRLDIPLIFGIDHIHGASYLEGTTIFPHSITLSCSFDPELAKTAAVITVEEAGHLGHHWNFNPVLDLARNKFWPRVHETYGEDPYLAARMGEAYVEGIQETTASNGAKMAATAKHFLGYSDPKTGRDRSPAIISDQQLHEIHRPAFQAAIDAGVKTVMLNSGEINGVPVHASYEVITKLLRQQMGFTGVVITDWEDIISLHAAHKVASSEKEAVYKAIMAGVDMSMVPYTTTFCDHLTELVKEGRIPMSRIDESVKRILDLKYDLGLFENPFPAQMNTTGRPENHEAAKEAVRESLVLMKNEQDILPLDQNATLVLAGSTSNIKRSLAGGWTYIWQHEDDSMFPEEMKTIQEALINRLGANRVKTANVSNINQRVVGADAVVIATGENTALSEGHNNITDLDLPVQDRDLIEAALKTGKPVIVILTEGRPRTFPDQVDAVDAILFAGLPGFFGAEIITEVLMGDVNPSGKLSFTYPYHQSFQINYDHKPTAFTFLHENDEETERYAIGYFGEGLSYTTFTYEDLKLSSSTLKGKQSTITATVKVSNTGDRDGKESVLWFIRQEYGQITRPVKSLKFFEKKEVAAGRSKTFAFEIDPLTDLAYPDAQGNPILEPGEYTLMTGNQKVGFVFEE